MLKLTFLPITIVVFIISVVNPVYPMNSAEEKENFSHFPPKKTDSNSDFEEKWDDDDSSSEDEEETQVVRTQPWGPTAEKLLIEALQKRGPLNHLEHEHDLRMLLDIAKTGIINPTTRTLAGVLMFFETKEAMEAASALNYGIALNSSFRFKDRENAAEHLEIINLPENKKRTYEVRTALARDKSLSFKERHASVKYFLYSHNIEDLKYAIKLFKEILEDHNYNNELINEIRSEVRSMYLTDWPDLYEYAQKRILQILGCSKAFDINYRFRLMDQLLELGKKGYYSTNDHESDVDKELFNAIKHRISEEEFKSLLRAKLAPLSEDKLQGSFLVVEGFYQTPDNELPPLKGNLVALLNLIGFDYLKEYEEAKKRIEVKHQVEFFESLSTYKSTRNIWQFIVEDARNDAHVKDELTQYIKDFPPVIRARIDDLLK